MMLTTKGRYAVMAMVDIAAHSKGRPLTLGEIAARQHIALNYLEQIFCKLRKEGLVISVRGPGGGYGLALPADAIYIADIIEAVEESVKITRCDALVQSGCMHDQTACMTHDLWEGLGNHIIDYLRSISLADVCNKKVSALNLSPRERGFHSFGEGYATGIS